LYFIIAALACNSSGAPFQGKYEAFMTHLELAVRPWVTILKLDVVIIVLAEHRFCLPQPP